MTANDALLRSLPNDLLLELKGKVATACRIPHASGLAPDYQGHASVHVPGTDPALIKARGGLTGSLAQTRPEHVVAVRLPTWNHFASLGPLPVRTQSNAP